MNPNPMPRPRPVRLALPGSPPVGCTVARLRRATALSGDLAAMLLAVAMPVAALAAPQGGVVQAGSASIAQSGATTTITQTSERAILDWQSFDIAAGETTRFVQPSSDSVALNRVTGPQAEASRIAGNLAANGKVVLVNPNGVIFAKTAQVDVAGLVATTAAPDTAAFMATGALAFAGGGKPDARIENAGSITVREAGLAAFVAPAVVNSGTITARLGKVTLAGAETAVVDFYGDGLINFAVTDTTLRTAVENGGMISADGGSITLSAVAARDLLDATVRPTPPPGAVVVHTGVSQANTTADGQTGRIRILATTPDGKQAAGGVAVSGVVQARGWAQPAAGDMPQRGGVIQISGKTTVVDQAVVDVSGRDGGGQLRIGGEYLGGKTGEPLPGLKVKNLQTPNSQNTFIGANTLLLGDALERGNGGNLVVWADGKTAFYGGISARGGTQTGNGGFVEVSGHGHLDFQAQFVDLTSQNPLGRKGTLLLDPTDITISNFAPNDASVASNLKLWLDASDASTVTLSYDTDGLSSATASGTSGTNTITTSADVSASLAVGARIRLGAAGATTTANTLGSDTYTIASISGISITTVETLTGTYAAQTLRRGLVSQWNDKSGNSNNATQGTASSRPLWIAGNGGQNGNGVVKFDGVSDFFASQLNIDLRNGFSLFFSANNLTRKDYNGIFRVANNFSGIESILEFYWQAGTSGSGNLVTVANRNIYGMAWGNQINNAGNNPSFSNIISTQSDGHPHFKQYINGSEEQSISNSYYSGSRDIRSLSGYYVGIGYAGMGSYYLDGKINDSIVYGSPLSTNSRHLLNQYQSAKWAIALTPPGTGATEATKAMASDGYSVFHKGYLEYLSQSANIALVADNSITINDLTANGGDGILSLASGRSLSLTAGAGGITMANTANTLRTNGGAISMATTGGGAITLGNLDTTGNGSTAAGAAITLSGGNIATQALRAGTGGDISLTGNGTLSLASITSSRDVTLQGARSLTTTQNWRAGRNLILGSGASLTASGTGDALTLAATGNFINGSGSATPISVTGGGRYLVYSTSPLLDTYGGMSRPNKRYNFAYGSSTAGLTGGPWHLYSLAPTLSITADAQSKIYGTANPTLTYSVTGLIDGDTAGAALSGNLATTATTASGVGSYSITQGTLAASALGYGISGYTAGTLTINPAALTITADNTSKTYGSANPALSASYSGLVNGDTAAVVSGLSLATAATTSSNVGSYAITASGGTASNYTITYASGTLTINPAALTITADNLSKTYGSTNPALTASYSGLVNGDTSAVVSGLSLATAATTSSNVGSYMITASGGTASNYTITYASGTLTINPAALTITADNTSKTYGSADPAFGYALTSGALVGSDSFSGALSRAAGENVGSYAIGQGTLTAGSNYTLTYVGANFTITPAALTITADNTSKTYGSADPAFGYALTSGALVGSDSFSGALSRAAGENVGSYAIGQGTLTAGSNYTLTYVGANFTITPAALTITADNASKVYGSANPALTASYSGLVNGDTSAVVSGLSLATAATAASSVGSYAITASGGTASNYTITRVNGTLTINPAALTITANSLSKVYGSANPTLTASYSGLVNGDTAAVVSGLSLATAATASSNVGSYAITASGGTASNYTITRINGTLTINPAALTITADNLTKVHGSADPAFGYTLASGALVGSDGFSGALSRAAGENIGSYAITQGTLTAGSNYTLSYVWANLTIIPAAVLTASITSAGMPVTVARNDSPLTPAKIMTDLRRPFDSWFYDPFTKRDAAAQDDDALAQRLEQEERDAAPASRFKRLLTDFQAFLRSQNP